METMGATMQRNLFEEIHDGFEALAKGRTPMHPEAEKHYRQLQADLEASETNLAALEAKLKTDEEHLAGFVAPPRLEVKDTQTKYIDDLASLKEFLNGISEEDLEHWRLCSTYDGVYLELDLNRFENDEEYYTRLKKLQQNYIDQSKNKLEKDLRHNIRGLKKRINTIKGSMEKIVPAPTAMDALMETLKDLPEEQKNTILTQAARAFRAKNE